MKVQLNSFQHSPRLPGAETKKQKKNNLVVKLLFYQGHQENVLLSKITSLFSVCRLLTSWITATPLVLFRETMSGSCAEQEKHHQYNMQLKC